MPSDLLERKKTHFVLWRPRETDPVPKLVIGRFQHGNPPTLVDQRELELRPSAAAPDLWEIAALDCGLADGQVYHYWFAVRDSNPGKPSHPVIRCTDPTAWTVDWRLRALPPDPAAFPGFGEDDRDPAGVVMFKDGHLVPCDPGGETPNWAGDPDIRELAPNNRLVMYELPTAWIRPEELEGGMQVGVGTFRDTRALVETDIGPTEFAGVPALERGRAHLRDLGVNALELLPPADSFVDREWGYATSNYFAADFDLGFPRWHLGPTATTDLAALVGACHQNGIRFFADMVMAFATRYSYQNINFPDFHVQPGVGDPDEFDQGNRRDAFGGDLFRYNRPMSAYDPVGGGTRELYPARRLMLTYLERWMRDFRIDGVRMDSVVNFASWDFIRDFKDHGRAVWRERAAAQSLGADEAEERFLVVGEELAVPVALVSENRLDTLWNEHFKRLVRSAILGETAAGEPSFESTVRKLIDCRRLGFADGAQAVNYVTSHDVEGFRNERLYNFLNNNGVVETERRIKLAFACLLTAVGVPMILAGEEFADQHDLSVGHPYKQVDPVNFARADESWRRRIFEQVCRLVRLRTSSPALAVNDTAFIHVDIASDRRVLAWLRGRPGADDPVVVVANFSDFASAAPLGGEAEYRVAGWPTTPVGRGWREVTQDRAVPPEWIGREPLFPWEAKVYVLS